MALRTFFRIGKKSIIFLFFVICVSSCKKLIEIDAPQTSINEENVYKTDVTAIAAVTSIYATMSDLSESAGFTGSMSLSLLAGLSADELTLYAGVTDNKLIAYYKNWLISTSSQNYGSEFWPCFYNYIFRCNAAVEGLSSSNSLTPLVKQQLLGEAKFMRGFFYFYLLNLFQNVPITLTTDPAVNAVLPQATKQELLQQITNDLIDAQSLLSPEFLDGNLTKYSGIAERIRPTKWAATALLGRVYLYNEDYPNAELQATAVIDQSALFGLVPLSNIFLKNSYEAIWQLQPVRTNRNTEDAFTFILPATGPTPSANSNPVYLSTQLLNAFESNDQRKANWVNSVSVGSNTYHYPFKYKATSTSGSVTEYLMILRLVEQFLIRAEARVQQNNISGAQNDLNEIRARAGLANISVNDKASLMNAILHERQIELFTELGHRWFDLKRTNNVNIVMSINAPIKGSTWSPNWQLYPIPFDDIQRNSKLFQNPGY